MTFDDYGAKVWAGLLLIDMPPIALGAFPLVTVTGIMILIDLDRGRRPRLGVAIWLGLVYMAWIAVGHTAMGWVDTFFVSGESDVQRGAAGTSLLQTALAVIVGVSLGRHLDGKRPPSDPPRE
jgi:hypothetical protein